jgi:hypothetical protein
MYQYIQKQYKPLPCGDTISKPIYANAIVELFVSLLSPVSSFRNGAVKWAIYRRSRGFVRTDVERNIHKRFILFKFELIVLFNYLFMYLFIYSRAYSTT